MLHDLPGPPLLTRTLTRAELVEFAHAVGETRPEYVDAAAARRAGHPDVLAAPTYLFCLTLRADDPWGWARAEGFDMGRTLHGEQSFVHHALVHAGDEVTLSATSGDVEMVGAGARRLARRARVVRAGQCVAELVTTLVMKEPTA